MFFIIYDNIFFFVWNVEILLYTIFEYRFTDFHVFWNNFNIFFMSTHLVFSMFTHLFFSINVFMFKFCITNFFCSSHYSSLCRILLQCIQPGITRPYVSNDSVSTVEIWNPLIEIAFVDFELLQYITITRETQSLRTSCLLLDCTSLGSSVFWNLHRWIREIRS